MSKLKDELIEIKDYLKNQKYIIKLLVVIKYIQLHLQHMAF